MLLLHFTHNLPLKRFTILDRLRTRPIPLIFHRSVNLFQDGTPDLANYPSPIAHSETAPSAIPSQGLPPSGVPAVESQIPDPKSQIPNSLEERVAAYILARYLEARDGRNPQIVGKHAAWNFKSQLQYCPCGNALPCNDHGDFPDHFWTTDPSRSDFMDHMHAHGFDLSLGWALIREYNQQQRIQALERAEAEAAAKSNTTPQS